MQPTRTAPAAFHVMAKPTGATCNLACRYCFFLPKEALYPGSSFSMTDEVLEAYIRQMIASQAVPEVTIAWQGGEPTLMGLGFLQRALAIECLLQRSGTTITNVVQTNGMLLDDEWCAFLHDNRFLVGLSMDGPRRMHDAYRLDKGGRPTFDSVRSAARLLVKHRVDFNILCAVHAANADHPLPVYRFLRDDVGARFVQFIPIVEREAGVSGQQAGAVTARSVQAEQYGRFLIGVFDEWLRRDVGTVFVQTFDAALAAWLGAPPGVCIFAPTCGGALVLEHNGDLYSCDHFVEPPYLLGNIMQQDMLGLAGSEQQMAFGRAKLETLPRVCLACDVRFACNGECPKNRFTAAPDGEPGLNYLCAAYRMFFHHADGPLRLTAALLRQGRSASEAMPMLAAQQAEARPSRRHSAGY